MSARFSEEEARQIFARAAERQHTVGAQAEGLTVDELQAIGAEAGLDPAHVAAAVAELRAAPADPAPLVFGVDPAPRRVRVLPGAMTDEAWGQLVRRFKREFGGVGIASRYGDVREWTSGPTSNLHVVAEPVEGGTRLTFETHRENAAAPIWGLPGMGLGLGLMFLVLGVMKDKLAEPGIWFLLAMAAAIAVVGGVGARWSLGAWSRTRATQFEALLDEAEQVLAPASTPADPLDAPREASLETDRIDPALLGDDAAEAPAREATRRRTR